MARITGKEGEVADNKIGGIVEWSINNDVEKPIIKFPTISFTATLPARFSKELSDEIKLDYIKNIFSLNAVLNFDIKACDKIPQYATKHSFDLTIDEFETKDVHFIKREYKRHPNEIFLYGYYLK